MVDILDSMTLQRLQTLETPQDVSAHHMALGFSPDSHVLTCSSGGHSSNLDEDLPELFVVSWDLRTGAVVCLIRREGHRGDIVGSPSITHSANGKMVGVFYWYYTTVTISIYDVASGVHVHSYSLTSLFATGDRDNDGPLSNDIWIHGDSLRFTALKQSTFTIWEVGFTSGATPTEVETLSVPGSGAVRTFVDNSDRTEQVRFLPASSRLAIAYAGRAMVWDARNSKTLLRHTDVKRNPRMSFSSDGRFFACSATGSGIYIWKESPTGYQLHGTLASSTEYSNPLLSPNGESIITFGGRTIQLWHTGRVTSTSINSTQGTANFVLDFSPDGELAAVMRKGDDTIKVLNLKSGVPQLTINTSMKVYGLKLTEHTVVVIGDGKVITWNIRKHVGHIPVGCSMLVTNYGSLSKIKQHSVS